MGLFDKLGDKVVEKLTGKETICLPCENMVQLVSDIFIFGNDEEYLNNLLRIAEGKWYKKDGETYFNITSADGRYMLKVTKISGSKKQVWIQDDAANKFYQLDKDKEWKRFYQAVDARIKMHRINSFNAANFASPQCEGEQHRKELKL